jgi:hypothetical protein
MGKTGFGNLGCWFTLGGSAGWPIDERHENRRNVPIGDDPQQAANRQ